MDAKESLMKMFAAMMGLTENSGANYAEIKKLDAMLNDAEIPHEFGPRFDGYQITYFGKQGKPTPKPGCGYGSGMGAICSAVEMTGSYGCEDDRIEIQGLLLPEECEEDSVVGGLSAEEVFVRIKDHWEHEQGK